ncbi:NUDIX hydrolase [Sphingobium subterraneum]|uniref:8-oxo-dGTP pyrophosphatase MutT (NUDIX family) n=1 Tax=Sphingobium subterraneum TaxID=627688 RepID=A0A841J3Q3_9SPHN|nr:NUDIX domain-containing protein [Sphingobium subterraneum]MBB6123148.1 8-oxo-dGTP pyrophosphatase MutT (NUDIX family) [Sphingobium subterraneum]
MSDTAVSPPVRSAATLIILRDVGRGPEVLMVERHEQLAFAGGALVFPGGAVDPADFAHVQVIGPALEREDGAGRIAAIRETLEESGLAVGFDQAGDVDAVRALRAALEASTPFADALAAAGLALDLDALLPFARWRPPPHIHRVFDTRFYLAMVDADHHEAVADGRETARTLWARPAELLDAAARQEAKVIFPTRCNLERLAQFDSITAIFAHARAQPVELVVPRTEVRDGEKYLTIPEGIGYPRTAELLINAMRG